MERGHSRLLIFKITNMEGIYQQDTQSLVKDVKYMFPREEILRSNKENVLTVKSDFLPLAEVLRAHSQWGHNAGLDEITDFSGSGSRTLPDLEATIKYRCFSSVPFLHIY